MPNSPSILIVQDTLWEEILDNFAVLVKIDGDDMNCAVSVGSHLFYYILKPWKISTQRLLLRAKDALEPV